MLWKPSTMTKRLRGSTGPSEQIALLRWLIATFGHEILRHGYLLGQRKETLPRAGPARQDYIACYRIAPDEDFIAFEATIGRQANGLASAFLEQFCGTPHRSPLLHR